jgi:hypothetical protein
MSLAIERQDSLENRMPEPGLRSQKDSDAVELGLRDLGVARDYVDYLKPHYEEWVRSQVPPQWAAEWSASSTSLPKP